MRGIRRFPLSASVIAASFVAAVLGPDPLPGQTVSDAEAAMLEYVDRHVDDAVALLQRTVNINSGTMNLEGVRQMARVMAPEFEALGFDVRIVEQPPELNRGPHLFAEHRGDAPGPGLLLIGHLDTVFEEDHPFQNFQRDGDRATGPGIQDMKGGNIVMLLALQALHHAGALEGTNITVALTGDEESPGRPLEVSRRDLIEAGRWADVALGFESMVRDEDGEHGTVARRSSSRWTLTVEGRQGHSSRIFSPELGAGAIFEAARILNGFYQEVRGEELLTFNAGAIVGGTEVTFDPEDTRGTAFGKTNVVPQKVIVRGGLRTITQDQLERAREAMREVVADHLPGTSAEIVFDEGYPSMPPTQGNRALLEAYGQVSRDLELGPIGELDPGRRGAADIAFVAPYVDGLAGIGIQGGGAHSPEEWADLGSISRQAKRAAVFIHRLTRGDVMP